MNIPDHDRFGRNNELYHLSLDSQRLLSYYEAKKLSESYHKKGKVARKNKVKQFNKISYYVVYVRARDKKRDILH